MTVDVRLAVPAVAAWVASAITIGLSALPVAVGLWAAAGVALAAVLVLRRGAVIAIAVAAAAVCCTSAAAQTPARHPDGLDGERMTVTAFATEVITPGTTRFEVTVTGAADRQVRVPVLVFGEPPAGRVGIGATLALEGRFVASDPGDDVAYLMFADGAPRVVSAPPWPLEWANTLRTSFLGAATALPGDGGALLAGLAIGDTSAVSSELDSAMKASSLSHLTAVSGANCAIVIALIMSAGAALALSRWLRITLSLLVLVGFVVLVTPEPSVLRAAVMAALVLLTLGTGRPVRGIPVLALAVLVLLVVDPWLSRNYGFILSVLATGGLLVLAGPLAGALERWMPRWVALVVAVPLAAQLACQPVILLLTPSLPTYGVIANVLAEPAAPLATVIGLAGCVLLAIAPPLGELLCRIAWLPSAWIAGVARFFAGLPMAQLPWLPGVAGILALMGVSVLALVAALRRRRWAVLGLAASIVAYVAIVGAARIATELGRPDWQIAGCDVGQGDAFLVRSAGRVALIDTGREPRPLRECLSDLGVTHLDLLVLTHYDLDHAGGVRAVEAMADTAFVGPRGRPSDDVIVSGLRSAGVDVHQVARGPTGLLGDLRWRLLWPPQRLAGIEPGNNAGVTVEFEPAGTCADGCLSSVFLADLGAEAQERMLAANPQLGRVDVVKVSHHGSADQYEPLYERVRASVGLIGVGVDNDYGHPTDAALGMLARSGTAVVRTDEHGLILLAPGDSPGAIVVWTSR